MTTSCTIIISHFESLPFLRACVRQIRKYVHPEIEQHIIIADQSGQGIHETVMSEFGNSPDITVAKMKGLYSGYGIDYVMRYVPISTEYICQLHVDAFAIHKNWLYLSIKLIEENNFEFVGQHHFISKPTDTEYYYLKNMFFSMSPTFNVSRTTTYKELSFEAGFTRFHQRPNIDVPMAFSNSDWDEWAKEDYRKRGSDDDVIAFCWEDNHREHNKLGLAVTGTVGIPPDEAGYGRIIEDIVFHFSSCREAIGVGELMGKKYCEWTRRINNGFDDTLIEEMLNLARLNSFDAAIHRQVWDGKMKKSFPSSIELNKRIDELKE